MILCSVPRFSGWEHWFHLFVTTRCTFECLNLELCLSALYWCAEVCVCVCVCVRSRKWVGVGFKEAEKESRAWKHSCFSKALEIHQSSSGCWDISHINKTTWGFIDRPTTETVCTTFSLFLSVRSDFTRRIVPEDPPWCSLDTFNKNTSWLNTNAALCSDRGVASALCLTPDPSHVISWGKQT